MPSLADDKQVSASAQKSCGDAAGPTTNERSDDAVSPPTSEAKEHDLEPLSVKAIALALLSTLAPRETVELGRYNPTVGSKFLRGCKSRRDFADYFGTKRVKGLGDFGYMASPSGLRLLLQVFGVPKHKLPNKSTLKQWVRKARANECPPVEFAYQGPTTVGTDDEDTAPSTLTAAPAKPARARPKPMPVIITPTSSSKTSSSKHHKKKKDKAKKKHQHSSDVRKAKEKKHHHHHRKQAKPDAIDETPIDQGNRSTPQEAGGKKKRKTPMSPPPAPIANRKLSVTAASGCQDVKPIPMLLNLVHDSDSEQDKSNDEDFSPGNTGRKKARINKTHADSSPTCERPSSPSKLVGKQAPTRQSKLQLSKLAKPTPTLVAPSTSASSASPPEMVKDSSVATSEAILAALSKLDAKFEQLATEQNRLKEKVDSTQVTSKPPPDSHGFLAQNQVAVTPTGPTVAITTPAVSNATTTTTTTGIGAARRLDFSTPSPLSTSATSVAALSGSSPSAAKTNNNNSGGSSNNGGTPSITTTSTASTASDLCPSVGSSTTMTTTGGSSLGLADYDCPVVLAEAGGSNQLEDYYGQEVEWEPRPHPSTYQYHNHHHHHHEGSSSSSLLAGGTTTTTSSASAELSGSYGSMIDSVIACAQPPAVQTPSLVEQSPTKDLDHDYISSRRRREDNDPHHLLEDDLYDSYPSPTAIAALSQDLENAATQQSATAHSPTQPTASLTPMPGGGSVVDPIGATQPFSGILNATSQYPLIDEEDSEPTTRVDKGKELEEDADADRRRALRSADASPILSGASQPSSPPPATSVAKEKDKALTAAAGSDTTPTTTAKDKADGKARKPSSRQEPAKRAKPRPTVTTAKASADKQSGSSSSSSRSTRSSSSTSSAKPKAKADQAKKATGSASGVTAIRTRVRPATNTSSATTKKRTSSGSSSSAATASSSRPARTRYRTSHRNSDYHYETEEEPIEDEDQDDEPGQKPEFADDPNDDDEEDEDNQDKANEEEEDDIVDEPASAKARSRSSSRRPSAAAAATSRKPAKPKPSTATGGSKRKADDELPRAKPKPAAAVSAASHKASATSPHPLPLKKQLNTRTAAEKAAAATDKPAAAADAPKETAKEPAGQDKAPDKATEPRVDSVAKEAAKSAPA
jgi:hypothetical protein